MTAPEPKAVTALKGMVEIVSIRGNVLSVRADLVDGPYRLLQCCYGNR